MIMAISDEITRLQQAKADLKTAIENKGVTVSSNATLDDYADLVDSITAGGGDNTDEWTYIKCDTLVTGTNPNAKAGTKFYIQYTNSSNLIVEFISTINYTTNTWGSNKLVSTEPTDSIDFETWYRIKPNNMNVGDTGTLTITQTTGTVIYTFKLIKTFSETTELDVSATDLGADIEKLDINGVDSGDYEYLSYTDMVGGFTQDVPLMEKNLLIKQTNVSMRVNIPITYRNSSTLKQFTYTIPTGSTYYFLCPKNSTSVTVLNKKAIVSIS